MKAIHSLITKVDGENITITGKIADVNFPMFVGQRTTILHSVQGNPSQPRHIQINTHGAMVIRKGAEGVLFPKDELVSVMLEVDSKLTDAPIFAAHPTKENLLGEIKSELPLTTKIQCSDDGKTWEDVKYIKKLKPVSGKHYRCIASNKNGEVVSNHVCVK